MSDCLTEIARRAEPHFRAGEDAFPAKRFRHILNR
jgi:hypothetical protein